VNAIDAVFRSFRPATRRQTAHACAVQRRAACSARTAGQKRHCAIVRHNAHVNTANVSHPREHHARYKGYGGNRREQNEQKDTAKTREPERKYGCYAVLRHKSARPL